TSTCPVPLRPPATCERVLHVVRAMPTRSADAHWCTVLVLHDVRAGSGIRMSALESPRPEDSETFWRIERLDAARRDLYRVLDFITEHGRPVDDAIIREAVAAARIRPWEMSEEQEESL